MDGRKIRERAVTALFIILFGAADRFSGGPYAKQIGIPVRPVAVAFAVMFAVLFVMHPRWAPVAVAWAAWRWPGWGVFFGGKIDPRSAAELKAYFLRHLLVAGMIPAFWYAGWSVAGGILTVLLFAAAATALGRLLAWYADRGKDINFWVELGRGMILGLLVGALK